MQKLFLTFIILSILGCQNKQSHYKNTNFVGPVLTCPTDSSLQLFRLNKTSLSNYRFCYSDSASELIVNKQIFSKIKWLKLQKKFTSAEELIKQSIKLSNNPKSLQKELVELYIHQKIWDKALKVADAMELQVNDSIRLLIEANIGQFSVGSNLDLLPQIYKNQINGVAPLRAIVKSNESTTFELTRVDNAIGGVSALEPSLIVSDNGENVLVTWMDDSASTNDTIYYRSQTAYSSDGGETWVNYFTSPNAEQETMHHFDLMTAYDSNNNLMYVGGLTVSFLEPELDSYYIYKLDLTTGTLDEPFVHQENSSTFLTYDKGLLTVNNDGELWMPLSRPPITKVSTDSGETFTDVGNVPGGMAQPVFNDDCLYLLSHNHGGLWSCDLPSNNSLPVPNTSNYIFDNFLPGNFRAIAFSYLAIHPDGDIYVLYPDIVDVNSDEIAMWMSKSSDNGESWDNSWIVTPDIVGDRFLQWIEIDQQGGIHISYMDTRNVSQTDNAISATMDMYYSYSVDQGQTWEETRVTPTSVTVPNLEQEGYLFSDYLEMAVANPESVFLSFPWSVNNSDLDMYVAKKQIRTDLIYANSFEVELLNY